MRDFHTFRLSGSPGGIHNRGYIIDGHRAGTFVNPEIRNIHTGLFNPDHSRIFQAQHVFQTATAVLFGTDQLTHRIRFTHH